MQQRRGDVKRSLRAGLRTTAAAAARHVARDGQAVTTGQHYASKVRMAHAGQSAAAMHATRRTRPRAQQASPGAAAIAENEQPASVPGRRLLVGHVGHGKILALVAVAAFHRLAQDDLLGDTVALL